MFFNRKKGIWLGYGFGLLLRNVKVEQDRNVILGENRIEAYLFLASLLGLAPKCLAHRGLLELDFI